MFFDIADVLIGVVQSGGEREQLHSFSITGRLYSGLKTEMMSSVVNIPQVASDANYGHEFSSSGGRSLVDGSDRFQGWRDEIGNHAHKGLRFGPILGIPAQDEIYRTVTVFQIGHETADDVG